MVPTLFRRFLKEVAEGRVFDSVRYVVLGAEVALRGDIELFERHFAEHCRVIHLLGATETGRIAHFVMKDAGELTDAVVPAGFPVRDKELLLLDGDMQPVPDGETGELFVRSSNLAQGYWNDPELNAAKFIPDPGGSAKRLYRTGDLARFRSDGVLLHLGRLDATVKIHGFSVDLQEIERVLLEGPGIAEGAVVAPETQAGERRVAAYFVPTESYDDAELRAHFEARVPAYMVPSSLVALARLPLTPRGKLDRTGLEQRSLQTAERPYSHPRSELEISLAAIWGGVLGIDRVGLDDEFFELGGDSIQAYELISAVYHQLGVDLPASTLLSASSMKDQAELIESGSGRSARSLVPFRETGSKEPFFCVHGIGGGVLFLGKLLPHLDPDRPICGLQPEVMEREDASYLTVSEMASDYIAEIRTIQPTGPYFIGGTCFGGLVAQEMGRLLEEHGEHVASLVLIDPPAPHYVRPEMTRWKATKKQIRKVLFTRRRKRIQAGKRERRDRTEHLRQLHDAAAKEHRPEPSEVPLHILGAKATTPRHEWMWAATAKGGISIEEFPAPHGEMYEPRNNPRIAEMLNEHWSEIERNRRNTGVPIPQADTTHE
jgi:thioesterase domain-containing protein/acyl carrier protein